MLILDNLHPTLKSTLTNILLSTNLIEIISNFHKYFWLISSLGRILFSQIDFPWPGCRHTGGTPGWVCKARWTCSKFTLPSSPLSSSSLLCRHHHYFSGGDRVRPCWRRAECSWAGKEFPWLHARSCHWSETFATRSLSSEKGQGGPCVLFCEGHDHAVAQ